MKRIISTTLFFWVINIGFSQNLKSNDTFISFFSEKESIKAENSEVISTLNVSTGEITFAVDINKFIFPNSMMQKHFNQEGIMNSIEFPNANFSGKVTNNQTVDYTTDGTYKVTVSGTMTIKGISKDITTQGKIIITKGEISARSAFDLDRFQYGVDAKEDAVSKILLITVKATYH
jgi:polyisoprenoid-binding protein YceI